VPLSQQQRSHALLFSLTGQQQGAVFPLHGTSVDLGRGPDANINLDDDAVSGSHARIVRRSDGMYLVDAVSRNGTFVNEHRITEPRRLSDGDHLRLGNTVLKFSMVNELEERALNNLFELTVRDPLTRAYNRRYLMQHLRSELAFSARQGLSLALLLVDIDHFKQVNDAHGHAVGDVVLQLVASTIQRLLRPYDALCRYGGEEFVVVARDTSLRNAEILAQRMRRQIEALRFDAGGSIGAVTVSIGVTATQPQSGAKDADALLIAVDDALYEAKEAGRNRVRSSPPQAQAHHCIEPRARYTAPPQPPNSLEASTVDFGSPALPRFN
jgi:diguanylate cyclase (GGDEF)-like protein